ncbi:MAG: hypothetical protein R6V04_05970 [bacterium]
MVNLIFKNVKIISIISLVATSFFPRLAKAQTIHINPYIQPNDSTLAWYGSGDLNNDNKRTQEDLDLMQSKTGSVDQADINGNGTPFEEDDYALLSNHINNGDIPVSQRLCLCEK